MPAVYASQVTVKQEIASIVEVEGGQAFVLLDEDTFEGRTEGEQKSILKAFMTLARDQLLSEADAVPEEAKIMKSSIAEYSEAVVVLRMLLDEEGEFGLVTHFGGKAHPSTSLSRGLRHAALVVAILESDLD